MKWGNLFCSSFPSALFKWWEARTLNTGRQEFDQRWEVQIGTKNAVTLSGLHL